MLGAQVQAGGAPGFSLCHLLLLPRHHLLPVPSQLPEGASSQCGLAAPVQTLALVPTSVGGRGGGARKLLIGRWWGLLHDRSGCASVCERV